MDNDNLTTQRGTMTRAEFIAGIAIDDSSYQACFDSLAAFETHVATNLNRVDWLSGDNASSALKNVNTIRLYLTLRSSACRRRERGDIVRAQAIENDSDKLYNELPADWQW